MRGRTHEEERGRAGGAGKGHGVAGASGSKPRGSAHSEGAPHHISGISLSRLFLVGPWDMAKWQTTRAARQILRAAGGFEKRHLAGSGGALFHWGICWMAGFF